MKGTRESNQSISHSEKASNYKSIFTSSHFNFFEKHPILSAYRYYCTVLVVNTVVSLRSESTLCSVQEEYIYMSGGVRAERDEITSRDEKNFQDT